MSTEPHATRRNPGPSWGYRFLRGADRLLPEALFRPARALGTLIAMGGMPVQRRHSREYLRVILGRDPSWREIFRHFFAFEEGLMQRLRIANGQHYECDYAPGAEAFRDWMEDQAPVLLGTLHLGVSDMLGFQLAKKLRHPIYLVRLRVGNSHDTDALARQFASGLRFVWINDPKEMLFALKEALASPSAVAIQCDRIDHGARTASFDFLGAKRLFPITIYHLALIFQRPVLLSFGVPGAGGRSRLYASPLFQPDPRESREAALGRAQAHFQAFLRVVESTLREQPYLWFNFTPLNPTVAETPEFAAR